MPALRIEQHGSTNLKNKVRLTIDPKFEMSQQQKYKNRRTVLMSDSKVACLIYWFTVAMLWLITGFIWGNLHCYLSVLYLIFAQDSHSSLTDDLQI